jgi:triphosphoribosyl-dephospho-CoA synthase
MSLPDFDTELAALVRRACCLEVLARKPGNVHPGASFSDLTWDDFIRSADAIAAQLPRTAELGVGAAVLAAIEATSHVVPTNSNLGMVLLLAPLAAVPRERTLRDGIDEVLQATTVEDARLVYHAIRLAKPGGLGRAAEQDVLDEPTETLVEVMRLAADRDRVAAQYDNGFRDVLEFGVPSLLGWSNRTSDWETAVIGLHLSLMAQLPDTLIARKCGGVAAAESASRAQLVLDRGWPDAEAGVWALGELDAWLRADGHRRNPGTTADLVAATLFAALRDHGWDGALPNDGRFHEA